MFSRIKRKPHVYQKASVQAAIRARRERKPQGSILSSEKSHNLVTGSISTVLWRWSSVSLSVYCCGRHRDFRARQIQVLISGSPLYVVVWHQAVFLAWVSASSLMQCRQNLSPSPVAGWVDGTEVWSLCYELSPGSLLPHCWSWPPFVSHLYLRDDFYDSKD